MLEFITPRNDFCNADIADLLQPTLASLQLVAARPILQLGKHSAWAESVSPGTSENFQSFALKALHRSETNAVRATKIFSKNATC
jgi:hypothetical protein